MVLLMPYWQYKKDTSFGEGVQGKKLSFKVIIKNKIKKKRKKKLLIFRKFYCKRLQNVVQSKC